jgi:hypothetical protein
LPGPDRPPDGGDFDAPTVDLESAITARDGLDYSPFVIRARLNRLLSALRPNAFRRNVRFQTVNADFNELI